MTTSSLPPERILIESSMLEKLFIQSDLEFCNDLASVQEAIKNGADLYYKDSRAVKNSIQQGKLDILTYFVSLGYDLSTYPNYGLEYAAKNGHLDVIEYLLSQGADIGYNSNEALRYSAFVGHLPCVLFFIEQGCDKAIALEAANDSIKDYIVKLIDSEKLASKLTVALDNEQDYNDNHSTKI
jgi:ankyrin repeat protein